MKQRKWKGKIKNTIENERKLKTTNEKEKKKRKTRYIVVLGVVIL